MRVLATSVCIFVYGHYYLGLWFVVVFNLLQSILKKKLLVMLYALNLRNVHFFLSLLSIKYFFGVLWKIIVEGHISYLYIYYILSRSIVPYKDCNAPKEICILDKLNNMWVDNNNESELKRESFLNLQTFFFLLLRRKHYFG